MNNKCGYVSIIGRPNVGKSTLLNQLIGEKLAGVSSKPQTTRGPVRGILTEKPGQAVFVDTPGWHEPKDLLSRWMMGEIQKTFKDSDLIYFMVLPTNPHPFERKMMELFKETSAPIFLLINQIDRFGKEEALPAIEWYSQAFPFKEIIPISAKEGTQIELLKELTYQHLPEGPNLFPDDDISDQNERFIATEIIREKIYQKTHKEIPYACAVVIDTFKDRNEKITDIEATIFVERESQKGIVVGRQGAMMKEISMESRADLEQMLGKKVFLKMWVKVENDWKSNKESLKKFGYKS